MRQRFSVSRCCCGDAGETQTWDGYVSFTLADDGYTAQLGFWLGLSGFPYRPEGFATQPHQGPGCGIGRGIVNRHTESDLENDTFEDVFIQTYPWGYAKILKDAGATIPSADLSLFVRYDDLRTPNGFAPGLDVAQDFPAGPTALPSSATLYIKPSPVELSSYIQGESVAGWDSYAMSFTPLDDGYDLRATVTASVQNLVDHAQFGLNGPLGLPQIYLGFRIQFSGGGAFGNLNSRSIGSSLPAGFSTLTAINPHSVLNSAFYDNLDLRLIIV